MYKQLLILDSIQSTLINNEIYKFNLNNMRIKSFKLKNYLINNINMSSAKYLCCGELTKHCVNRNKDGRGENSDIIALITDDIEISNNNHDLVLSKSHIFKNIHLYFKDSNNNYVLPSDFVVVLEIYKDAE